MRPALLGSGLGSFHGSSPNGIVHPEMLFGIQNPGNTPATSIPQFPTICQVIYSILLLHFPFICLTMLREKRKRRQKNDVIIFLELHSPQIPGMWDDELQNIIHMGFIPTAVTGGAENSSTNLNFGFESNSRTLFTP